jgi:S1-C subfamily serine protease
MTAQRRISMLAPLVASVALVVVGAGLASAAWLWLAPAVAPPAPAAPVVVTPRGDLAPAEQSTVELFRNASPSVVYITKLAVRADPFRRNLLEIPEGTGSGFVWDRQGHVVTNHHVIAGADGARVTLSDGSTWPAQLVGAVAAKDLAVLRIQAPAEQLTPLPIGTSHDLLVGQHVFAIGNPFGLDHTLSTGVVSGLEREIMSAGGRPIQGVIQTDAAINPGNSGGPLLDSAGRLIGVNTAIYSPSGASAGIGFAVPVDTVARVVPQLIAHGRVIRPVLGVHLADPPTLQRLRLLGALVLAMEPGSPAERAGLQPTRRDVFGRLILGDLIVGVDDQPVNEPVDLYRILDRREVGDTVRLRVRRAGQELEVQTQLAGMYAE